MKQYSWLPLFLCLGLQAADLSVEHEWEEFVKQRYEPEAKKKEEYRDYGDADQRVKNFYYDNHTNQTLALVLEKKKEYLPLNHKEMGIWDAMKILDEVVDESDPDLQMPQSVHAYQTAEALRKAGHPRWLILTGFIHDLGKMLTVYDEPQWCVVGDTFPVGCAFSDKIVFSEFFAENPDVLQNQYQSQYGIYHPGCGLDQVHMSWGHDEYLFHVVREYLPREALYIIRYHSFYALHQENQYDYLLSNYDREMLPWLKLFSQFDLYSKAEEEIDVDKIKPYYEELVAEFFPSKLHW